jgi:DNA-binding MarR family transcriptional regulator
MHEVFFGIKRAHLEVVWRLTGPLIERSGLTPVRFDLMRIVELKKAYGVGQEALQWFLGVSKPTVSRMLKSLEELGWVRRVCHERDRRRRVVHITESGTKAVEMALAATVGNREAERHVARVATGETAGRKRVSNDDTATTIGAAASSVDDLKRTLTRIRKALFDFAPFPHPWRAVTYPLNFHDIVDGCIRFGDEVWPIDPNWIRAQEVAAAAAELESSVEEEPLALLYE